jgi:hypothetical protein
VIVPLLLILASPLGPRPADRIMKSESGYPNSEVKPRPTSGPSRFRRTLVLLVSCVSTAVVLFLPVILTYGIAGWLAEIRSQYQSAGSAHGGAFLLFGYRAVYAIGPLAVLSSLWIVLQKRTVVAAWRNRDDLFVGSIAALCALGALFAFLPLEKLYLLPGIPFLLVILDRLATQRALSFFVLCLVSFAFVNPDVIQHKGARGTPGLTIHPGMVIEEWQQRRELAEWRDRLAGTHVPPRTVIMTGAGPMFWLENDGVEPVDSSIVRDVHDVVVQRKGDASVLFVPMIPREEAERLESLGWHVACDERNRDYIEQTTGYRGNLQP